jgi:hypothetical protein
MAAAAKPPAGYVSFVEQAARSGFSKFFGRDEGSDDESGSSYNRGAIQPQSVASRVSD